MADAKKKPKKKAPPVLTPEELRASAQKQVAGAVLALDFRDQANYYQKAAALLQSIPDDDASAALAREYLHQAEEISVSGYQTAYEQAVACKEHACKADDFYQAANAFRKIEEYQDASKLADECEKRYAALSHRKRPALVIALLVLVLLATAAIGVQTSFGKYELGRMALTTSHYSGALSIFSRLEDYRDSETLAEESRYQLAQQHMESKRYQKAIPHFQKLGHYKDSEAQQAFAEQQVLGSASPGDTVTFGSAEWIVLNVEEGCALLLQNEPTEQAQGFHNQLADVTWKDCNARAWLNAAYLSETFSQPERAILVSDQAEQLNDPVFLLSVAEAERYGSFLEDTDYNWWLRTSGVSPKTAAFVSPSNQVMDYGYPVDNTGIRLRPAVWVDCSIS